MYSCLYQSEKVKYNLILSSGLSCSFLHSIMDSFPSRCPLNTTWDQPPSSFLVYATSPFVPTVKMSKVDWGIDHFKPIIVRKMSQSWVVTLQCRNRWWFVSAVSQQKRKIDLSCIPLLSNLSFVKQACLTTNQTKQFTLYGILVLQMCFLGQELDLLSVL